MPASTTNSPMTTTTTTSSETQTTNTVVETTTTTSHGVIAVTDLSKKPVSFKLNISINKIFPKTKEEENELKADFNKTLYSAFSNLTEFERIVIIRLRPGSVYCDFKIIFKTGTTLKKVANSFNTSIGVLRTATVGNVRVNIGTIADNFATIVETQLSQHGDACALYDLKECDMGYNCNKAGTNDAQCTPKCNSYDCGNHGECVFSQSSKAVLCRCEEDDDYVYSGDRCETRREKLAMKKDTIIAIAASSGGFVVIFSVVIIAVLLVRRHRTKKSSEGKDLDTTPAFVGRARRNSGLWEYNRGPMNEYIDIQRKTSRGSFRDNPAYEMPLYLQGRENDYSELTEYDGSKAYIYSPSQQQQQQQQQHHYQQQTVRYGSDRSSVGSTLHDFPQEKFDIPRARVGRW